MSPYFLLLFHLRNKSSYGLTNVLFFTCFHANTMRRFTFCLYRRKISKKLLGQGGRFIVSKI